MKHIIKFLKYLFPDYQNNKISTKYELIEAINDMFKEDNKLIYTITLKLSEFDYEICINAYMKKDNKWEFIEDIDDMEEIELFLYKSQTVYNNEELKIKIQNENIDGIIYINKELNIDNETIKIDSKDTIWAYCKIEKLSPRYR